MEENLIRQAQKDDKAALEKLLQNNYPILKGYLIKMTLDETLADDLAQETMVKAILKVKKYEPKGKFSTWLIAIATNLYRDYLRKSKRLVYSEEAMESSNTDSLEDAIIMKSDFSKLKSILSRLPEDKRMVFILKHYYGYSYQEIADIMKCPVGTVRSRLHYSIEKIKAEMKGVEEDE